MGVEKQPTKLDYSGAVGAKCGSVYAQLAVALVEKEALTLPSRILRCENPKESMVSNIKRQTLLGAFIQQSIFNPKTGIMFWPEDQKGARAESRMTGTHFWRTALFQHNHVRVLDNEQIAWNNLQVQHYCW